MCIAAEGQAEGSAVRGGERSGGHGGETHGGEMKVNTAWVRLSLVFLFRLLNVYIFQGCIREY